MAEAKKITAKEAGIAVLKKFSELLIKAEQDGKVPFKTEEVLEKGNKHSWGDLDNKLGRDTGVHKPVGDRQHGMSSAGIGARQAHNYQNKESLQYAKDQHKHVISQQKNMPKPNLPKSEKEEGTPLKKEESNSPPPSPPPVGDGKTINDQIGNPFGKSEGQIKGHFKLAKFIGHISGKRSARGPSKMAPGNTGHEKGINTSTDPSQKSRVMMGTSKAGSTLPPGKSDPNGDIAEAKTKHQKVLGEMKQMPKPKLPG